MFGAKKGWLMMGLVLCAGCESSAPQVDPPLRTAKSSTPQPSPSSAATPSGEPGGTTEKNFGGAVFQVPAAWEEKPKQSDFITAELRVPGPHESGRLTLSAAGGDVESNIDRWRGQFQRVDDSPDAKESQLTVDGREATLVELFGTFRDGFGGGSPKNDWAMLGAVVPLKQNNYFVKLTGPRETIEQARDTFVKFVETAKFKE